MLCLGMHSIVMLRFMVQAFQDTPLCSSTRIYQVISRFVNATRKKKIYLFFSREPAARMPNLPPRSNKREESNQFFFTYCSKF
jgi:hypothetical protein